MKAIGRPLLFTLICLSAFPQAPKRKHRHWIKLTRQCGAVEELPRRYKRVEENNVELSDEQKTKVFEVLFAGKKGTQDPELRVAISGSFTAPHRNEIFVIAYLFANLSMAEGQGYFGHALIRDGEIIPLEIEDMPYGLWGSSEITAVDLDGDGVMEILFHREAMHQVTYGGLDIFSLKGGHPVTLQGFQTYSASDEFDPKTGDLITNSDCWTVYWNRGPLTDPHSFRVIK